jgi:hypothetical protein
LRWQLAFVLLTRLHVPFKRGCWCVLDATIFPASDFPSDAVMAGGFGRGVGVGSGACPSLLIGG